MRKFWFSFLIASICLEGLGRKYLPSIPPIAFYFFKDVVLLWGAFTFRPPSSVTRLGNRLFSGFAPLWGMAVLWTFLEAFNPEHQSLLLAAIGLRAYWLWWLAPFVIAGVLQRPDQRRRAILTLVIVTMGISVLAAVQFVSPADSVVNLYSVVDGEAQYASETGIVYQTGRPRVSGTFSFISGFSDFTVLIPALLLSLGLETRDRRLRLLALVATMMAAAVLPMAGSRSSLILGGGVLVLTSWSAGLFFTVIGRRIMIGALAAAILSVVAFPDALFGVQSRFEADETQERVLQTALVIPPVALLALDYPLAGIGTGMQQNARFSLKVTAAWDAELEMGRYLIELGAIGFLLVWSTKLGLMVAFLRARKILKAAKRRAAAGAALSYAAVTFFGNITFDHIWQSLYFVGAGFILAETLAAVELMRAAADASAAAQPESSPAQTAA